MALLLLEGFDCYGTLATTWTDTNWSVQLLRNWDTKSGVGGGYNASAILFAGRGSGLAFGCFSDTSNAQYLQRNLGTPAPTVILGCSFMSTGTTGNANHTIFTLFDSAGTEMGRLYLNGSGGQLVYRNGSSTIILTSSFAGGITLNTWYTVELKVTAGTTTGYVEIHVNGTSVGSASSVNTVGAALTTGMQQLAIGAKAASANFNNSQWDHLVVMDSSGTSLNDFIGDKRITTLVPNGVGSHSDWTPTGAAANWDCVNETGIDQDTSYNAAATVGNTDSYTLLDLLSTTQPVYAVQVSGHVKRDDAVTTRQVRLVVRSGGTDALVGSATLTAVDYSTRLLALLPQNPVSTAAWTNADVQALEAGVRVIA